ncbi:MAG TPA: heavy metal-associated domain-containing protein [Acidimicrobiia bacterium]|nr:heavy metal-associated domain-containing protein [Acidimicrobiia bacterium]
MTESTYSVTGMTCDHCVRAVQAAVAGIAGVVSVTVDLGSGRVTLTSDGPVDPDRVKVAVEEAGYEVTG